LALPLICLLLLGVVQVAVVIRNQLAAIEAARVAVRAAAVSADPATAAASAGAASVNLPVRVSTSVNGNFVSSKVTIHTATDIPLIGLLLPDLDLTATATMSLEPP
jgi:hypothetical protein